MDIPGVAGRRLLDLERLDLVPRGEVFASLGELLDPPLGDPLEPGPLTVREADFGELV